MKKSVHLLIAGIIACGLSVSTASAQSVLFDFNDAPLRSPFPITITKGSITAYFSATGYGYSIQDNSAPVFPIGFSGRDIYPSSVYLSDLLIKYNKTLTDFSILYACQELGCDDAATMRVTAYKSGVYVGTNTKVATHPGTWPVDTLRGSFAGGFDSVVIHYDHRPPTCTDYGVIFLCDDMIVTEQVSTAVLNATTALAAINYPNPVSGEVPVTFTLSRPETLRIDVYAINGQPVKTLFVGTLNSGAHTLYWNVQEDDISDGMYLLRFSGEQLNQTGKIVVLR